MDAYAGLQDDIDPFYNLPLGPRFIILSRYTSFHKLLDLDHDAADTRKRLAQLINLVD